MIAFSAQIINSKKNPDKKPDTLRVLPDNLPAELKALKQWVGWRWVWMDKRAEWSKVPIDLATWGNASSTDPTTWVTFQRALECYLDEDSNLAGIGFVLSVQDPYTALDLDKCKGEDLDQWAKSIMDEIPSYCETSPSATGIRIVCRAKLPGALCRTGNIEMYDHARYITLTGHGGNLRDITDCQGQIDKLYTRLFPAKEKPVEPKPSMALADKDVLRRALDASNGDKFRSLYYGKWDKAGYTSRSEAEYALLGLLRFWTQDKGQIDRLFRSSALCEADKWDRLSAKTIDKILASGGETYRHGELLETKGMNEMNDRNSYCFNPIHARDFAQRQYTQEWLINSILVKGQPAIVGGQKKVLKTSVLMDLTLSLGSGSAFLGKFPVPQVRRTCFISGESGDAVLQDTARRVCKSKKIELEDTDTSFDFRLPKLSKAGELASLSLGLAKRNIEVVIIDPLYLCLLAGQDTKSASNLYDMGPLLSEVAQVCLSAGCTPILVHHARKGFGKEAFQPADLEDLAFSGVQEFARQWLLLSRRELYQLGTGYHPLWLNVGGSAGHNSLWAIDIVEGKMDEHFGGRHWGVEVYSASEAIKQHKDAKVERRFEKKAKEDDEAVRELMNCLAPLAPQSRNKLRLRTGWSVGKFNRIMARAEQDNLVICNDDNLVMKRKTQG